MGQNVQGSSNDRPPLFQEWFGLSRRLNSNFANNKKFGIVFFFDGISFKDVVTRRENSFSRLPSFFLFANFYTIIIVL